MKRPTPLKGPPPAEPALLQQAPGGSSWARGGFALLRPTPLKGLPPAEPALLQQAPGGAPRARGGLRRAVGPLVAGEAKRSPVGRRDGLPPMKPMAVKQAAGGVAQRGQANEVARRGQAPYGLVRRKMEHAPHMLDQLFFWKCRN